MTACVSYLMELRAAPSPKPAVPPIARVHRLSRRITGTHGLIRGAATHFESGRQVDEGEHLNALDFHIACHLGRVLEKSPQVHCTVLSKDKGFDPLLRQLNKIGLKCQRINSLLELDPKSAPVDDPNYKRVVELLGKSDKKARPRRLKTLSQHISSMFQKNIAQKDIDRIIDMLFANKLISESNNTISYGF